MVNPALLADAVLMLHAGFIAFVLFGLLAVLAGIPLHWRWTRRPLWRACHLACIGLVVAQAWAGIVCPLTLLENDLRRRAGQATYDAGFIADWLHRIIFFEAEPWIFTCAYTLFGLLVIATWVMAPPKWRR